MKSSVFVGIIRTPPIWFSVTRVKNGFIVNVLALNQLKLKILMNIFVWAAVVDIIYHI